MLDIGSRTFPVKPHLCGMDSWDIVEPQQATGARICPIQGMQTQTDCPWRALDRICIILAAWHLSPVLLQQHHYVPPTSSSLQPLPPSPKHFSSIAFITVLSLDLQCPLENLISHHICMFNKNNSKHQKQAVPRLALRSICDNWILRKPSTFWILMRFRL